MYDDADANRFTRGRRGGGALRLDDDGELKRHSLPPHAELLIENVCLKSNFEKINCFVLELLSRK